MRASLPHDGPRIPGCTFAEAGVDLEDLFARGMLKRPPEHLVLAAMREMGITPQVDEVGQLDMFAGSTALQHKAAAA